MSRYLPTSLALSVDAMDKFSFSVTLSTDIVSSQCVDAMNKLSL